MSLFGLVLAAGGLLHLSGLEPDSSYLGAVVPGFVAMGFGVGNVWLPMTMAATGNVEGSDQGLASGLVNTSQQVGGALGLAVLTTLAGDRTGDVLAESASPASPAAQAAAAVDGYTLAFAVGAGLMLAAATVLFSALRSDDVDVRGGAATPLPEPA